jgi:hypothetical protein
VKHPKLGKIVNQIEMSSPAARKNLKEMLERQMAENEARVADCDMVSQYQRMLHHNKFNARHAQ